MHGLSALGGCRWQQGALPGNDLRAGADFVLMCLAPSLQPELPCNLRAELCWPSCPSSRGEAGGGGSWILCLSYEFRGGCPLSTVPVGSDWVGAGGEWAVSGLSVRSPRPPLLSWLAPGPLSTSFAHRVSVPLLKMLDQMLANGCFDIFTAEEE